MIKRISVSVISMAKMIPPYCDEATTSETDHRVFQILKNDPATVNWIVLHLICLAKRGRNPYGEIGFVLLVPAGGVFCLGIPGSEPSRIPVVPFTTIQAFKGMESSVVIMCDVDRMDGPEDRSLLYVGMSRARNLLIVFLDERVRWAVKTAIERKLSARWRATS